MRNWAGKWLLFGLMMLTSVSLGAQEASQNGTDEKPAVAQAPLAFIPGKTTLAQAQEYWKTNGMQVLGTGYLAIGAGSGIDGAADASAKDVELYDVSGVDFEGINVARYGFYSGVLFVVQVKLSSMFKMEKLYVKYSEADIQELKKRLIAKYGAPHEKIKSIYAEKQPDILVWKQGESRLILQTSGINSMLALKNKKMEDKVANYQKKVCKELNKAGKNIC